MDGRESLCGLSVSTQWMKFFHVLSFNWELILSLLSVPLWTLSVPIFPVVYFTYCRTVLSIRSDVTSAPEKQEIRRPLPKIHTRHTRWYTYIQTYIQCGWNFLLSVTACVAFIGNLVIYSMFIHIFYREFVTLIFYWK